MIKIIHLLLLIILLLVISPLITVAQENTSVIETDSLSTKPGDIGNHLGAEVKSVDSAGSLGTKLQIVVPVDPDKVDKVEIYDSSGNEIPQLSRPSILKDYEESRVGVKFHVNKNRGFEFRVRLIDVVDIPPTRGE